MKPSVGMIAEGMKFIVKNQRIKGAFFTDMSVTLLGTSTALFPAITALYFSDDPTILGYFMAAPALGGFLGSICSGQLTKVKREGRAVIILAFSYAVSIMCFGLSVDSVIFLPLFFLMLSGAADSLMVVLNQTIVVHTTPDHLRSRVNSVEYLLGFGGPPTRRLSCWGSRNGALPKRCYNARWNDVNPCCRSNLSIITILSYISC